MMDKLKTVLLTALVISSLLQSYLLIYVTPSFDKAETSAAEYVDPGFNGTQNNLENMITPVQIILHFGDKTHSVLYPDDTFFNKIFPIIKQRTFDGFHAFSKYDLDWDQIRDKDQGIEIRFDYGIPVDLLKKIMHIQNDSFGDFDLLNRIWIFTDKDKEEVRTFFFSDSGLSVYETTKADLTVKDVETFVGFGEVQPRYYPMNDSVYVPKEPLTIVGHRLLYDQFTLNQMQKSLFFDPNVTRNLTERDGTSIYTDGKRGLQIDRDKSWMIYTDPVAPVKSRNNLLENLYSAVQFVNQHGGWSGKYVYRNIPNETLYGSKVMFQQYYGSYPIVVESKQNNFGYIRLNVEKGAVSNYERSMMVLNSISLKKTQRSLIGGKELEKRIIEKVDPFFVKTILPAYKPIIKPNFIDLVPVWAIEMTDGSYLYLDSTP